MQVISLASIYTMNTPPPPNWNTHSTGPLQQARLFDSMTVTIKAYLQGGAEIRRFVFEDLREYKTLHQRIRLAFPVLADKDFTLSWRDAEGDQIIMSTDPELVQAVQNMKDGLLRIFVTITGTPKPEPVGPSGDGAFKVHAGVLCDVCDQEIHGARYKCLQCEDYDLCEGCHAKKTHEQHDMLKLVNPGVRPLWAFPGWKRLWKHCGHHRRGGRGGGAWAARGPQPPPEQEPASPQQYHDLLRNIGGTVANFLEPFGITVDVLNDMGTNTGAAQGQAKKDSATEPMDTSHAQPEPASTEQGKKTPTDNTQGAAASANASPAPPSGGGPFATAADSAGAAPKQAPPPRSFEPAQDSEVYPGWTLLNALRDSFVSEEGNLPPPMRPQAPPQLATVQPPTAPPPATQQSRTDTPVDTALAQMLAMGFNNEGGWLKQLLEVKQGDIGAVLESLHPSRQM